MGFVSFFLGVFLREGAVFDFGLESRVLLRNAAAGVCSFFLALERVKVTLERVTMRVGFVRAIVAHCNVHTNTQRSQKIGMIAETNRA